MEEDDTTSTPMGIVTIIATVTDSSHGIYTPCLYRIEDVIVEDGFQQLVISELKSYRGTFTEQVKQGDRIKARGTLEKVVLDGGSFYRLMMGGSGDYLLSV